MAEPLTVLQQTLFAELIERALDRQFDSDFAENGNFVIRTFKRSEGAERAFYYYVGYDKASGRTKGRQFSRYVGPADDPAVASRVQRFKEIKSARKETASIVTALAAGGLARPPVIAGRVLESLAKAGMFRLRAVLVGTLAYQTYPALLGMRLSNRAAATQDIDIAQYPSIAVAVDDQMEPFIETLRQADGTFKPVPHVNDPVASTVFQNASGFRVDIIAAHRGSDDVIGKPVKMPALAGAAAEPLRFMDYLIREPQRSVLLHGSGISVTVPEPERFAVHKLIIATRRRDDAAGRLKSQKDVMQAGEIISAVIQGGRTERFAQMLTEARERGPAWREAIEQSAAGLDASVRRFL
jgi:hypothetical protein